MAERAQVFQRFQAGIETTPNVPVAETRIFGTIKVVPHIMTATEEFTGSGYKFPNIVAINEEWCDWSIDGAIEFNEIIYMLGSLLTAPSVGSITGGKSYVFQPSFNSADAPYTLTAGFGDLTYAERATNFIVTDGTLSFNRKSQTFKGKAISTRLDTTAPLDVGPAANAVQTITVGGTFTGGTFTISYNGQSVTVVPAETTTTLQAKLVALTNIGAAGVVVTGSYASNTGTFILTFSGGIMTDLFVDALTVDGSLMTGSTPTVSIAQTTLGSGAAATALTLTPVLGTQVDVYLDTTFGAIGTTRFNRDFSIDVGITGRYGPFWPLRTSDQSFAGTVELMPKSAVKFVLEADSAGRTPLTYMRAGSTVYMRIKVTGPTLGAGTIYSMTIDMPIKIHDPEAFSSQEGIEAIGYNALLVSDPTAGYPIKVTVQNAVTTL